MSNHSCFRRENPLVTDQWAVMVRLNPMFWKKKWEFGISCVFIMSQIPICITDLTMLCASEIINHIMHLLSSNPDHVSHSASVFLNDS